MRVNEFKAWFAGLLEGTGKKGLTDELFDKLCDEIEKLEPDVVTLDSTFSCRCSGNCQPYKRDWSYPEVTFTSPNCSNCRNEGDINYG